MKKISWKLGLIIALLLNIIAYIFGHNSDCFTAFCALSVIYIIFYIDEKNHK